MSKTLRKIKNQDFIFEHSPVKILALRNYSFQIGKSIFLHRSYYGKLYPNNLKCLCNGGGEAIAHITEVLLEFGIQSLLVGSSLAQPGVPYSYNMGTVW